MALFRRMAIPRAGRLRIGLPIRGARPAHNGGLPLGRYPGARPCAGPLSATVVPSDTPITLTAKANPGSAFTSINIACFGQDGLEQGPSGTSAKNQTQKV